jgi:glycosyltransferase involved in cell wall biosynthesis
MKITFVLPHIAFYPMGGYKIIYQYANELCKKGHLVNLVHTARVDPNLDKLDKIKKYTKYLFVKLNLPRYRNSWFNFRIGINFIWVPSLKDEYISNADIVVATAWNTATWVNNYSDVKGKKFYFIQSFETWWGSEKEVNETWKMDLHKIVVAKWLKDLAISLNESAEYVPNGFDMSEFNIEINPSERDPFSVLMLYHDLKVKGTTFGLEALVKYKSIKDNLNVTLFGSFPRPIDLPSWIHYYQSPITNKIKRIYNKNAIFISPSLLEGFPLPPAEAMLCGCAVLASDIGGHREYCIPGKTAVLFPPKNVEKIIEGLDLLINDNALRIRLAKDGHEFIKQFTIEDSCDILEDIFRNALSKKN